MHITANKPLIRAIKILLLLILLSVWFPLHSTHIQTSYSKDPVQLEVDSRLSNYSVEPLAFEKIQSYSRGIRILQDVHIINAKTSGILLPGGEVEFIEKNLVSTTIVHAKLPASVEGQLDLMALKRQGTSRIYIHCAFIVLGVFLLLWPAFKQGIKSVYRAPHGKLLTTYIILWAALMFWAAGLLSYNHGPDELLRFFSGFWYFNHTLPTSMNDPHFIAEAWGVNYLLGSPDLPFLVHYKLLNIFEAFFDAPLFLQVRYVQVAVVLFIMGITARFAGVNQAILFLGVFAVVPQASYLNLYATQDGFNLAIAMFALLYARYGKESLLLRTALAGIIILNTRQNYVLCLIPLAYFYLEQKQFKIKDCWRDVPWFALAGLLGGYKYWFDFYDQWSNGMSYVQYAMLHADENYKKLYAGVLAGHKNWHILSQPYWYFVAFASFFGVYGYLDFVLPVGYLLPVVIGFFYLLRATTRTGAILLVTMFLLSLAFLLYFNITFLPAAQGRYLYPFLACVPALLHNANKRLLWMIPLGLVISCLSLADFAAELPTYSREAIEVKKQ